MIAYTVWYANRVKRDPSLSIVGISAEDAAMAKADAAVPPPLSGRHKLKIDGYLG